MLQSVLWRADDSFWEFVLIFCCGFQGLNSDCLTWLQVPFPIVSSHLHSDHHAMICKADSFLTYECMHAFFAAFDSIYGLWTAVKWVVYKSVGWLLQPSYNLITLLYILMSTHCLKDNTSFVFSLGAVITITTLIFHFIFLILGEGLLIEFSCFFFVFIFPTQSIFLWILEQSIVVLENSRFKSLEKFAGNSSYILL